MTMLFNLLHVKVQIFVSVNMDPATDLTEESVSSWRRKVYDHRPLCLRANFACLPFDSLPQVAYTGVKHFLEVFVQ